MEIPTLTSKLFIFNAPGLNNFFMQLKMTISVRIHFFITLKILEKIPTNNLHNQKYHLNFIGKPLSRNHLGTFI